MHKRTTGLILRTYPLTESSLIVHWLTTDFGRLATVAKGARRPKSPFRGKLDLFFLAEFTFRRSRRSELHTLGEVQLSETFPELRHDLERLQQAAYGARLIEQITETDTPLAPYFELLRGLLAFVAQQPVQPATIFAFEMKVLAEFGLKPDLQTSSLSPGSRLVLEKLADLEWSDLPRLKLSFAQIDEAKLFLKNFLIHHTGKVPPGREEALHLGS